MKLHAKNLSMIMKLSFTIIQVKSTLLLLSFQTLNLDSLKLKKILLKPYPTSKEMKALMFKNKISDNNNMKSGHKKMLNTKNKLKTLMKPQNLSNIYKLVLLSHN